MIRRNMKLSGKLVSENLARVNCCPSGTIGALRRFKADAPSVLHPNALLPIAVALQSLNAIAGKRS